MCVYRDYSTRLKGWDYTDPGIYFVTMCTNADICWFGKIENKRMIQSKLGKIAKQYWSEIPKHHKNIQLDRYIIMPNHVHGIILIEGEGIYMINNTSRASCRDVACNVPTNNKNDKEKPVIHQSKKCNQMSKISPKAGSLSTIIRSYKSSVTSSAHNIGINEFKWQPRFYDHIIKNNNELIAIQKYVSNNPKKW